MRVSMRLSLIYLFVLISLISFVSAGSVTFTDPLDVYSYTIYDSNGNYIGDFNSTETILLDSSNNYQIFVKPNAVSLMSDPIHGVKWFLSYLPFVLGLMLCMFIAIGLVLIYKKGVRI